jgi:hypothetical protein
MDWLLNEPVVKAMAARLADELPAELARRRLGLPDDEAGMLLDPGQVLDYPPTPGLLTVFPTVAIADLPSTIEDDTGHAADGHHELLLLVYLTEPDQRLLAWGLRRYAQALLAVALRGRCLEGDPDVDEGRAAAWGTGASKPTVVWGDTLADEDDPRQLLSWVGVRVWAKRSEVA